MKGMAAAATGAGTAAPHRGGDRAGRQEEDVGVGGVEREQGVRWLIGQGLSEDDAEDLTGDAFLRLLEASPRNARGYFWVTLRKLLALHRRKRKEPDKPVEWIRDALHRQARPPDEDVLEKECRDLAEALVAELPDRQEEVARLLMDGWKVPEIAKHLGRAPSTVRSLARHLRERLGLVWLSALQPVDQPPEAGDVDGPAATD